MTREPYGSRIQIIGWGAVFAYNKLCAANSRKVQSPQAILQGLARDTEQSGGLANVVLALTHSLLNEEHFNFS